MAVVDGKKVAESSGWNIHGFHVTSFDQSDSWKLVGATTCPTIVAEGDDTIELSSYSRAVGTVVTIGCKGFGRHVKDPTRVTCLATGRWSETPNLQCEMGLDDKERIYLAVAIVSVLLVMFACCFITAAFLCCRGRRRGAGWWRDGGWRRGWWGGSGEKGSHGDRYYSSERIVNSKNRYDGTNQRASKWDAFYKKDNEEKQPKVEDDLEDNWFNKHGYTSKWQGKDDASENSHPTRRDQNEVWSTGNDRRSITFASVHDRSHDITGRRRSLDEFEHARSDDLHRSSRPMSESYRPYSPPFDYYGYKHSYEGYSVDPDERETGIAARYYDMATTSRDETTTDRRASGRPDLSRAEGGDSLLDALYASYIQDQAKGPRRF